MKFDGDPQQLGFFMAHILTYMKEFGPEIPSEGTKMRSVTLALEGAMALCMMTFHNANIPKLRNFNHFMVTFCRQFEDPLVDCKGTASRQCIKAIEWWQSTLRNFLTWHANSMTGCRISSSNVSRIN